MVCRNKLTIMIILLAGILTLFYFSMQFKAIEYKVFGLAGVILSTILYIINIFEYYVIDDEKITYVSKLKFKKEEIPWKDINRLTSCSDRYISAIIINYGGLYGKNIVISSWINRYNEIISIAVNKAKDNKGVLIDNKLYDYIN